MKPKRPQNILSIVAVLMLAGCATREARLTTDSQSTVPGSFTAAIGGFLGPASYRVELQNGVLYYSVSKASLPDEPIRTQITPTTQQWQEFRRSLDKLGVWNWKAQYENTMVRDGTHWSLDIGYADHSVHARGENDYPTSSGKSGGSGSTTKAFEDYLAAVEKLLGGKIFR